MEDGNAAARRITDLTRTELHALVWQSPLSKLAIEFGVSGFDLSRICKQNSIPCPPAGHWTRVALGQTAPPIPLAGTPLEPSASVEVHRSERQASPRKPAVVLKPSSPPPSPPPEPVDLSNIHPLIRVWITHHNRLQSERAEEIKRRKGRDMDWFGNTAIPDLTSRDLYRFRMTSELHYALERVGITIKSAAVNGKLSFTVATHTIECTVIEKMTRRLKEDRSWTAFPGHHQGGLVSTGFLRINVTTYILPTIPEWVETAKRKMHDLLPEIVQRIVDAAPILDRMEAERRESRRKYAEEVARREETARRRQIEKLRFERLGELADNWHRARQLASFIDELESRTGTGGQNELEGKSPAEWVAWARQRIANLDPFRQDPIDIFKTFLGNE